jgi:hypothetical protein
LDTHRFLMLKESYGLFRRLKIVFLHTKTGLAVHFSTNLAQPSQIKLPHPTHVQIASLSG